MHAMIREHYSAQPCALADVLGARTRMAARAEIPASGPQLGHETAGFSLIPRYTRYTATTP